MYKLILYLNSKEYELLVKKNENILNAVIKENFNPPYSCESGSCGLCKAKLIQGDVDRIKEDALSDHDIENNCILTCQAFLKSDTIISYDDVLKD